MPGGDRLFQALRPSTIGAEGFHGRVRDGISCWPLAITARQTKKRQEHRGIIFLTFKAFLFF
jgi:hypothetical protein